MKRVLVNDIDLEGVASLVISYSKKAADVGDLTARKFNFTNAFKCPETPANNITLQNTNNINSLTSLPYVLQRVKLIDDGVEIVPDGQLVVRKVQRGYELYVLSGAVGFFDAIKGRMLSDLSNTDLVGQWGTSASILARATATEGVVAAVFNLFKDFNQGDEVYEISNSLNIPSVFYHTIVNRIFSDAGYSLSGSVLTHPKFLKKAMPCLRQNNEYGSKFLDQFSASAIKTASQSIPTPGAGVLVTFDETTKQDAFGFWNLGTSKYDVDIEGIAADTGVIYLDVAVVLDITVAGGTVDVFIRGGTGNEFIINVGTGVHSVSTREYYEINDPDNNLVALNNPSGNYQVSVEIKTNTGTPAVTVNSAQILITALPTPLIGTTPDAGFDTVYFFNKMLPEISQLDVIQDFAIRFGLLFDDDAGVITSMSLEEIINNIAEGRDWTNKRVKHPDDELWFTPLGYAQSNEFLYSSDDVATKGMGRGQLTIANETIEESKEIFTSPFAASLMKRVVCINLSDEITGSILMAIVPAFDQATNTYQNPAARLLLLRDKYSYEPDVSFGPSGTSSDYQVAYFEDPDQEHSMSWQQQLTSNYSAFTDALQKAKMVKRRYMLTREDFRNVNFFYPIFDKDSWFIINDIPSFVPGRKTEVELLKVG